MISPPPIVVRGARTHNLQQISLTLPAGQLSVITGVSGSGKSSLAFQTLYAAGQRRYLTMLSGRARDWAQFLPRPDVDSITGLPPVIGVRQEHQPPRPHHTLASQTEILDYLRVLFARQGLIHCPECRIPVQASSPEQIIQHVLALPPGTKLMLLASVPEDWREDRSVLLTRSGQEGVVRVRLNGEVHDLSELPTWEAGAKPRLELIVDRLIVKPEIASRLAESVDQTLRLGGGTCLICTFENGGWHDTPLQTEPRCPQCRQLFPPLEPATFSWTSPQGACPACSGTGLSSTPDVPPPPARNRKSAQSPASKESDASPLVSQNSLFTSESPPCPACHGERLNPLAAQVRVQQWRLPELLRLPIPETRLQLQALQAEANSTQERLLAQRLIEPLLYRLDFLLAAGLDYLTLDRRSDTLSGGEQQRVWLARCLGTQLQGSCYILDEPTAGLHAADTARLIAVLRQMTADGNTVVCVEHNLQVIEAADYLIELGPGGGSQGGQLLFSGTVTQLQQHNQTATASALHEWQTQSAQTTPSATVTAPATSAPPPQRLPASNGNTSSRRSTSSEPSPQAATANTSARIQLQHASLHNLQDLTIEIPLQEFTCVTGVSGSGKSTLILDSLAPLLQRSLQQNQLQWSESPLGQLQRPAEIVGLHVVDHTPPGRSSRSCPATFSGVWEEIRKVLAKTKLSRLRGYSSRRFSLNAGEGACPTCQGTGSVRVKVQFLTETHTPCPTCQGARFNPATLAVTYKGQTPAQLLAMTIDQALDFWAEITTIQQKLQPLAAIGLGYLGLGQSFRTLSGGEAQRMKLARELALQQTGQVLILDEPTSGLHWADVNRLGKVLQSLVAAGNTLIVIEHHPLLLTFARWQIQLGPGAGHHGGQLLDCGPR